MFGWAIYDFVIKDNTSNTQVNEKQIENEQEQVYKDDVEAQDETEKEGVIGLDLGNIPPDFELSTIDGEVLKLSDFVGQKVMLNFWASWCGPCRAEMPDMEKFYKDKDVVILAVNLTETENKRENITKFIDDFSLTFPILLDEDLEVSTIYQIKPIPTTFLIDSNGRIHNKAFGALNYEQMVQELERMQ